MTELRPLGTQEKIEPWCLNCCIDPFTGGGYCSCGLTFQEREQSGWKLNGENKVVNHDD